MPLDDYWLRHILDDSPAVKALAARNASLILGFLHAAFKEKQIIAISNQDLVLQLAAFLEARGHDEETEGDVVDRAAQLVDSWCNEQNRYLRKYTDDRGVAQHELTPAMETALRWLDDLQPREFVGTESKFQDLLRRIADLAEKSSGDPERRIADLEERKAQIEAEIAGIRSTGRVQSFTPVQIRERLQEISSDARGLLADFRQVEQNFRDVVREIHREQSEGRSDRGGILGFTLDMVETLHGAPQGQSFDAFWRFLVADSGRDEIDGLVDQVYRVLGERNLEGPDPLLRRLKHHLHQAGRKVVESNRILAEKLNRILAERVIREQRKTRELIAEIKRLALLTVDNPPQDEAFLAIEGDARIGAAMARRLSLPQRETLFGAAEQAAGEISAADMAALFQQLSVDDRRLRAQIRALLESHSQVSLPEVLERYPVREGLAEIVTYLSLASVVSDGSSDEVSYEREGREVRVTVPRAVYSR